MEKSAHDLQRALAEQGVTSVVDVTTRYHGGSVEKLKELQEMVQNKVQLMYGYTPNENYILQRGLEVSKLREKLTHDIEYQMKVGTLGVLPSLIGELLITDFNDPY